MNNHDRPHREGLPGFADSEGLIRVTHRSDHITNLGEIRCDLLCRCWALRDTKDELLNHVPYFEIPKVPVSNSIKVQLVRLRLPQIAWLFTKTKNNQWVANSF